ncbi:hypothetical protein Fleli_2410 [Bernardetia litoralis DSM 6794]|uniref:Ig-like domain-containing protein n=1 Tax=Bernardetia litoralis (strain ATCC 23117 / DSM 6794 / NBRC 15988 / NCIMB 1366 / Fx l1 / Sio-4) TaxID=880071 RepID=I4ALE2_BERLS|nr:hypothetical protein [Bernardetia litoralis]AFM04777.1 hypothetical protein Fleli_2410 [Bernardetia litoralis DSM 6794]
MRNIQVLLFSFFIFISLTLVSHSLQAQLLQGIVTVNNGGSISNDKEGRVILKIFAKGASEMRVSNNASFIGARWEAFEGQKSWRLDAREDGIKTVYVQFRDGSGTMVSDPTVAQVELDRAPPTNPSVNINSGAEYTNARDRKVYLQLYCDEAYEMQVSNRSDFQDAPRWYPYKETVQGWPLTGGEGTKHVYARYRDYAGNISESAIDTIVVDQTPPKGKFEINKGAKFTTSRNVKLQFNAEGASDVSIQSLGTWVPYQKELDFELPAEQGPQVVAVKFRDKMGNQSKPAFARIILDLEAPSMPRILVNGGNRYTKSYNVNIRLSAIGASEMMVSNDPNLQGAEWQPYRYLLPSWTFDVADGEKMVYVKFRDQAGNETEIKSDKIILDQGQPSGGKIKIVSKEGTQGMTNNKEGLVNLELSVEGDDARYMMVSNTENFFEGRWEIYRNKVEDWKLAVGDGEKGVYVKFRDRAGNVSTPVSDKVVLDLTAPIDTRIAVEKRSKYVQSTSVAVNLYARGASEVMLGKSEQFAGGTWQKYEEEIKGWQLEGEDGKKVVYAKFKDEAGNETPPISTEIILDRVAPQNPQIRINKGDSVTNNPNKTVLMQAKADGAIMMELGMDAAFSGSRWINYQAGKNIPFTLPGEDGMKEIFARFKDEAGNISEVVSQKILLDRTPPIVGEVKINEGDNGTNVQTVGLTLNAQGATHMMLSNRIDFPEAKWESYNTTKQFTLVGEDGIKFVFVRYRDGVGNISEIAYDRIGLDRTAPTGGEITINKKAKYTTNINKYVTLRLRAKGVSEMRIGKSQTMDSASWQPFKPIIMNYILPNEDGENTVWVQFGDKSGNQTEPISASIILDRQAPFGEEIIINNSEPYTNKHHVKLDIMAEEASHMMITNLRGFPPPARWEEFKTTSNWTISGADGYKTVYIKFRDEAGNQSFVASSQILLDTQPPQPGIIRIEGGQTRVKDNQVTLLFNARQANYIMVSNSAKFDDGAYWQEYNKKIDWVLTGGEGYKRVYAKFKDTSENETGIIFAEITVEGF